MRGSLLTGYYPLRHGAVTNDLPVKAESQSVARALDAAGYQTGYIGKWHLAGVPRDQAIERERRLGFKEWKVCNCNHRYLESYYYDEENCRHEIDGYDAHTYTSLAIDFIRRKAGKPWGLWVSWGPPHDPYFDVPSQYLDLYKDQPLTLRPNVPPQIVARLDSPKRTPEEIRASLRGYYAQITALDDQFGRLIRALRETGELDRTLIIYTSDHGDMLGSQGWTNKQLPFEEAVRVPLIARLPGVVRQGVCDELIGLTDLPVSLMSLLGCPLPEPDGSDLEAIFREKQARGQEACYIFDLVPCHQSMDRGTDAWRGVRTVRYTYACHADGAPWLLFDNVADPFQLHNRVDDPELAPLREQLHAQTAQFAHRHDAMESWPALIERFGLKESWNESQRYFKRPEL